jgi:flagellar protein FliO/FliZ
MMLRNGVAPTALIAFLQPWGAIAQQAVQAAPAPPDSPLSLGGMAQVLFGLLIVLAAVVATAWLLRRFSFGQHAANGAVRVIGGVALGQRERLVLVEIGETWLVLGVAPGQVNTLHSLPRPADIPDTRNPSTETGFAARFAQALRRPSEK